jgi:hypothetical protein
MVKDRKGKYNDIMEDLEHQGERYEKKKIIVFKI